MSNFDLLTQGTLEYLNQDELTIAVYRNDEYRWLLIDNVLQSLMLINSPAKLTMPHQVKLTQLLSEVKLNTVVEFGLGGGNLRRFLAKHQPTMHVTSVEHSSIIIDIYHQFFNPENIDADIVNMDAFDYLNTMKPNAVDWLIYDLYSDQLENLALEKSLLTQLHQPLTKQGWLSLNLTGINNIGLQWLEWQLQKQFNSSPVTLTIDGFENKIVHVCKRC